MKYTFVTVAHSADLEPLELQARSMSLYLPVDLVQEIIVVENPYRVDWRANLLKHYGKLAKLVKFVTGESLGNVPQVGGWYTQQALKLLVANIVTTEQYVILDSKNHFVYAATLDDFQVNGKMPIRMVKYQGHPLEQELCGVLEYFGVPLANHVNNFCQTITPFVMKTSLAKIAMLKISNREHKCFDQCFVELLMQRKMTEFFLIQATIMQAGNRMSDYYAITKRNYPVVWELDAKQAAQGSNAVVKLINRATRNKLALFAVHRRAFALLDHTNKHNIARFWVKRKLFGDVQSALKYLG